MKRHHDSTAGEGSWPKIRILVSSVVFSLLLIFLGKPMAAEAAAKPEYEIKLATMAPENSSLMQIFNEMNAELLKESGGKLGFKMFAGFVLGDEDDVLRKLRIGLVHSAVFTTAALTDINTDLRTLQVPFLFHNYHEVDYVLGKLDGDLRRGFAQKGFEVMGWPELGFIYFMSTTPIASMEDLRGKRVWTRANSPMSQAVISKSGVATVAINAPDVMMGLQTNLLDVVYNSPYYALVTQWYTQIKYITDLPLSYIGGAMLVDRKTFARLPAPLQETLKKVTAKYLAQVIERTRKDNDDALQVILKRGIKLVTPTPSETKHFKDFSDEAMKDLGPAFLPRDTMKKVNDWLSEYRNLHPEKQ